MATHKENQNPNPSLPEDLLYDILLTLPVKTLLRLRSVCKSWLTLISSRDFIKNHLSKSTNDPRHTHHRLILCDWIRCRIFGIYAPDLLTCSVYSLFNESNTRVVDHECLTTILNAESNIRVVDHERHTKIPYDESNTRVVDKRLTNILDDESNTRVVDHERLTKILDDESNTRVVDEITNILDDESNTRVVDHERLAKILDDGSNTHVVDERLTLVLDYEPVINEPWCIDDSDMIKVQSVQGYCNGLVCLTCIYKFVYLWNPATRKARKLPNLVPKKSEKRFTYKYQYGFCYDELNDSFKVYAVYGFYNASEYQVSVYSTKSNCWRLIGDFPVGDHVPSDHQVIFANGVLHWVLRDRSYKESYIISLDINTEMYGEILLPKDREEGEYSWNLGNFRNSLSLLCKYDNHVDFWVLKKCGVEEVWTKLFTIPYMDTLDKFFNLKLICILVNGDIMLHISETDYCSTILLYNSNDNTFKDLVEMNFCEDLLYDYEADVYTYVESLVSP